MNRIYEPVFFHIDLDAFFASVEQHDHPEYRSKPVIVGGIPGDRRAVVSTASYEARKYGIHSAMPLSRAVELCPGGIFLRSNHRRYSEVSHQIMEIFSEFSPSVIRMSIDEAFIDATGTERLFGPPLEAAQKIKRRIREETGLTVSIGIAGTMYVAKIASGYKKPDGITIVPKGAEEEFMLSLPLEKIWGIGEKTLDRLKKAGIFTAKELHEKSLNLLAALFGESTGRFLYNAVRGSKEIVFGEEAKNRSISAERTYRFDLTDRYDIETAFMELSEQVIWRLHKENAHSRTVVLKIRYDDFRTVTVQESSDVPVTNTDDLFERCKQLFSKKYESPRGIRLLGVGVSNVEDADTPVQAELFESGSAKKARLEKAIFDMERKNQSLKIRKARLLASSRSATEEEQNSPSHHGLNG